MRTTLELLKSLEGSRFAIYDFTDKEAESVVGLTYKINSKPKDYSYNMIIKVTEDCSYTLYNRIYNVLSLTFVNQPKNPWINLTVYSIDDSMFRGILEGYHNIDDMWPKVYNFFKQYTPLDSQETFIEFCKTELGITEFDWN
jgi:hypothetical protein